MTFIGMFEIEITDPVAAAAYTMDWGRDERGQVGMAPYPTQDQQVAAAAQQAMFEGLDPEKVGFKLIYAGAQPRVVDPESGRYPAITIPEDTPRNDDGTLPDLD